MQKDSSLAQTYVCAEHVAPRAQRPKGCHLTGYGVLANTLYRALRASVAARARAPLKEITTRITSAALASGASLFELAFI